MNHGAGNRVVWQVPAQLAVDSFHAGRLLVGMNGGNAYEYYAMRALADSFNVSADAAAIRNEESAARYALRLWRRRPTADLLIKNLQALIWGPAHAAPREVAIAHHLDWHLAASSPARRLYFYQLVRQLRQMTVVVTVSEYWRRELQRVGCPWVEVIYNSFDTVEFDIDMPEADATVRKYGLPTDRPLVYIGNTGRGKGVEDVYAALKDAPFALFMTGNEPDKRLPVPCFNLERREYLCLLEASSVVLTMSRKLEGWTRVAHEAMMCESPVIGTGSGGLLELLQAGGQIVHPGAAGLREAGEAAMARRAELGSRGRAYAETLNLTYFNNAWVRLVTTLLSTKRATSPAGSLAKVADAD